MKKVFLNDLPTKIYKGKECIDWNNCLYHKVKFIYEDVEGLLEIVNYQTKCQSLTIKYNDNELKISSGSFCNCKIGKLLGKITSDFKIEIGTRFQDDKRDITIIDRKIIQEENVDKQGRKSIANRKYYQYKCNLCGFECNKHYSIKDKEYKDELWTLEGNLEHGKGCSCCANQIVVEHINSIVATDKWMIPYFQGGYDEAKKFMSNSNRSIHPICPDCGQVKSKKIMISTLNKTHSIGCPICGDGKSYPEKFAFSLLQQLNIDFDIEYSPEWIKSKRYDFFFELNNKEYILEMDGEFHTKNNEMNGQTKEESKAIDDYKDKLANEHGIEVIRIDCDYSELDYIKQNIIKSSLSTLFKLNNVDWLKCHEFSCNNLVKIACNYKENSPNMTTTEIGEVMHMCKPTVVKYLKKGNILGWCFYDTKEEQIKSANNASKSSRKPIEVFKDGISFGIVESSRELERKSKELFGTKFSNQSVLLVCNGKQSQYKGFNFSFYKK